MEVFLVQAFPSYSPPSPPMFGLTYAQGRKMNVERGWLIKTNREKVVAPSQKHKAKAHLCKLEAVFRTVVNVSALYLRRGVQTLMLAEAYLVFSHRKFIRTPEEENNGLKVMALNLHTLFQLI